MLISIIIPIFNADKYIKRCLEGVISQSYENLEIILVNDGSTDQSLSICKAYAEKDSRIILITQPNGGPAKARNVGIKRAKGTYIGFVDADDSIKKDFFEVMVMAAISSQAEIVITNLIRSTSNTHILQDNKLKKNSLLDKEYIKQNILKTYYVGNVGNFAPFYNKLYRKSFLEGYDLWIDESRIRAEDYWFNFFCFYRAENCFVLDYAGYYYNVDAIGSVMKTFREEQFDKFIETRVVLEQYNKEFNFAIDENKNSNNFIDQSNEYILMAILNRRNDKVYDVLKNSTFKNEYRNYEPNNFHTKIIKMAMKYGLYSIVFLIYKVWSCKMKP